MLPFLRYAISCAALLLPGFVCARLLGGRQPWALALPLSLLILFTGALVLDGLLVPFQWVTMLVWEVTVGGTLAVAVWKIRPKPPVREVTTGLDGIERLLAVGLGLTATAAVWRGFRAPLTGWDVPFRWEFLAVQMLRGETMSFYPPVTGRDFGMYFHPDGFAPVISLGYWWLYAGLGHPGLPGLAPLVLAQFFSTLALAGSAAASLGGRKAGLLAAALLAATPLFVRAVLIGQETGLTTLAMTGMVAVLMQARGPGDTKSLVLAALLAGVTGLAREYGPALGACGGLVVVWRRLGGRALAVFGGVFAAVMLPWHLRSWAHSGNPLYGHLAFLFPVNPVFDRLMSSYGEKFGFSRFSGAEWAALASQVGWETGWLLIAGMAAAVSLARRHGYLLGSMIVVAGLWAVSVGFTSGGVGYSLRVLNPALALLAIAAGVWIAARRQKGVLAGVTFLWMAYGLLATLLFPFSPAALPFARWWTSMAAPYRYTYAEQSLAAELPKILPAGTRILTENAYAHRALVEAGAAYEAVPIWSPEVAFLFDPKLDGAVQRQRLLERRITALFYYPESPNTDFCRANSALYAQDSANWKPIANFGGVFLVFQPKSAGTP